MFANTIQPGIISLFSSTGGHPLELFAVHVDDALPEDSAVLLLNDSEIEPKAPPPTTLIRPPALRKASESPQASSRDVLEEGYTLCHTVLHIQSPTLRTTYIRCPASSDTDLGIRLPRMHVQVRSLGRAFSLEVGVVDVSGVHGSVRCSTFQKEPNVSTSHTKRPPVLHLPLCFLDFNKHPLTSWTTISLDLAALITQFTVLSRKSSSDSEGDENLAQPAAPFPSPQFASVSYVKVYANCRLRRIWFSNSRTVNSDELPWEFKLYSSNS
ncbi:hypothetical protein BD410DRAFT_627080 [Rickenella mellea]|uniref:CFA20 domain-containing protein n=1 Tax=Rickenella mellea TaxID=50990 RepID=A0A4Y7QCL2_9AGAM|nr:hypothetical protein BD410DRAFT_627080 [Rickenella mellea]